jgi:cell division protein FtsI (penicillin-binding protein 3)
LIDERLRTRSLLLAVGLACAFVGVVGRLAWFQVVRHGELRAAAERQYGRTITLHAKRGAILDRTGEPLAVSTPADSLYADPRHIADAGALAARLAPLLHEPKAEIRKRLEGERGFVWVKRQITPSVSQSIRAMRQPGLGLVSEPLRLYPNRELAAHVIGFEGAEGLGLEGIERAWQSDLAGAPGKALVQRDALGRGVSTAPVVVKAPTAGASVRLTIDRTIQYIAERELDAAFRRTRSKAAMAVAADPRTGDILALAIRPTFNPNSFGTAGPNEWRNRAVTDPFEPGSTFKVILAAAALEQGVVRPDDRIYGENGVITVSKAKIHDWKKFGWLTFAEVLQNSSNVGSIKVGQALGRDRYYPYIVGFGFGSVTNVGLAGESRGLVREPQRWSGLSLATLSIGQEVSVTALQMVAAFGAVANGGRLMQPRLVKAVLDADGNTLRTYEPRVVRQVITPETATTLSRLLVKVVDEGTGHAAAIPGYEVGGKTGTAQKLDPATRRYSRAPGVLSFVGFAPATDPRIVMIVLLDEPKNEKWGSEAAAPIFASIGAAVLRHLDVPRSDSIPVQIVAGAAPSDHSRTQATAPLAEDGAIEDFPDGAMPSLAGKTLRQALRALAELPVEVEIAGRGVVVRQSPAAGEPVADGIVAKLELAPR